MILTMIMCERKVVNVIEYFHRRKSNNITAEIGGGQIVNGKLAGEKNGRVLKDTYMFQEKLW